ncbi:hypothetical protein [Brachybacterium alimentarium]|uniref:hypothetical protein n=1 Tax=Brachybacterium alimentarium TaxID=47845 RepID=UPI000DF4733D|nr:hypothetical protein [Brachybacterium alimentarium]RCS67336.1 hypothetical protein CIK73_11055 [Brachybacterium alimentarium]RCS93090.1 hypothetical protein CIK69_02315 [Brachybacterium alimentarium]
MWLLLFPVVAGVLGAALLRLVLRAKRPRLDRPAALVTALAAGASSLIMIVFSTSTVIPMYVADVPSFPWETYGAVRFVLPLALGILTVLLLGLPARSGRAGGAQLTRRTWTSFLSRPWVAILGIVLALVVILTLSAGVVSQPDEDGRFTRYVIELGNGGAETDFYGWHYSMAPMIALVILVVATVRAWAGIARPPHPEDVEQDIARRRLRSTNVARITTGALLLHLAAILRDLESTSRLSLTVGAESGEHFSTGSAFSDLAPFLEYGAPLVAAIGLGLWVHTALTALPASAGSASAASPAGSASSRRESA